MQIAVTGGSGFIGSHVVDKLIDADHTVSVLDLKEPHRADVTHKAADLLDCGSVSEALKGTDAVYHLAAMANVNDVFANPQLGVKLNIDGTINVLESARKNDLKRVILASTVWVYAGANTIEVNEKSPFYMPGAGHVYTTTKIASEFLCHDYKELYGVDFTILRYGIPYGPRARSGTVIPIFIKQVMNNKPITILGDGSQYRYFVYVEDLAEGNVAALKDKAKNEIYNLSGKEKISIKQIAETIKNVYEGKVEIEYKPQRPGDYKGKEVSAEKAKKELDWEPKTGFEEGMKRYVEWFVNDKK